MSSNKSGDGAARPRWGRGLNRRDFLRGTAALGLSATAADLACRSARAATPTRGGHLKLGIDNANSTDSLDPATYSASYMQVVGLQFYDTLTELDAKGEPQPSLAESWTPNADATVWVIKLRRGVAFHNGKEMTAADAVYSVEYHRSKAKKSPARAYLQALSDLRATGKHEITVTLNGGNADLPALLGDYHIGIGPADEPFNGVGTGAFILDRFEPGVRTLTRRNPNDWNANRGWVDSVETIAINDPTARLTALQSGAVHMMNHVSPRTVGLLQASPKFQVFNVSGAGYCCFPMRTDMAPYRNNDLRLALKYGVDREGMVKTVLQGFGAIGNDQPIPSFNPFYAADIPQRPYDPDKARFHFKKSGHDGQLRLSVSDAVFVGAVDSALLMQASLAKAGIDLQVVREPSDGYFTSVWMKKPFCADHWGGRPTADMALSVAYKSDAPWNETFWKRPDFDKLLVAARSELDRARRKQMYHDLQLMIVDDGGELIPMFNNLIDAAAGTVQGFEPSPLVEMGGLRAPERVWLAG